MNDLVKSEAVSHETTGMQASSNVFGSRNPAQTIQYASEIANALAPIIEKQGMYSVIQGKKHPKVESWLTLGALIGVLPREVEVKELQDGSFEARVELLNGAGRVVGGASAICGIEEPRWAKAERYARRSMATTRAIGKSYRIAFSWILQLAGYQPTPAEEMADEGYAAPKPEAPMRQQRAAAKATGFIETHTKPVGFNPADKTHQDALLKRMKEKGVDGNLFETIGEAMKGRPSADMDGIIEAASAGAQ